MIQVTSLRLLSQADAARASHMPENAPRETPDSAHADLRPGETLQQRTLYVARILITGGTVAKVAAVRLQNPALGVVAEEDFQLLLNPHQQFLAFHRETGFHTKSEEH